MLKVEKNLLQVIPIKELLIQNVIILKLLLKWSQKQAVITKEKKMQNVQYVDTYSKLLSMKCFLIVLVNGRQQNQHLVKKRELKKENVPYVARLKQEKLLHQDMTMAKLQLLRNQHVLKLVLRLRHVRNVVKKLQKQSLQQIISLALGQLLKQQLVKKRELKKENVLYVARLKQEKLLHQDMTMVKLQLLRNQHVLKLVLRLRHVSIVVKKSQK